MQSLSFKKSGFSAIPFFCIAILASQQAQANTYTASSVSYSDYHGYSGTTNVGGFSNIEGGYGGIASPGQISWNVTTTAGTASLSFQTIAYGSLDGTGPGSCCTDVLTVNVNGTEVFSGTFQLGGVGNNEILFNPSNAIVNASASSFDWNGGTVDVSGLTVNLLNGINTIQFVYSGDYQSTYDEGWGLNAASLAVNTVPEPETFTLFGLGLLGLAAMRKKAQFTAIELKKSSIILMPYSINDGMPPTQEAHRSRTMRSHIHFTLQPPKLADKVCFDRMLIGKPQQML